jgi:hypothetical protein
VHDDTQISSTIETQLAKRLMQYLNKTFLNMEFRIKKTSHQVLGEAETNYQGYFRKFFLYYK